MILVGKESFFWLTALSGGSAVVLAIYLYLSDGPVFRLDKSVTRKEAVDDED